MTTYIWKLEFGANREWHLHTVFIFDGQRVLRDGYLSMKIGDYWSDVITHRMGSYHSCNLTRNQYAFDGIGMVDYRDADKIDALKHSALNYLAKEDEQRAEFFDAGGKLVRSFGMAQYQPKQVVGGRPRLYV